MVELTERDEQLFDLLCSRTRSLVQNKYESPNTCVMSTRIGLEVLTYFGYRAEPQACWVAVYNKPFAEWVANGRQPPMDEEAATAAGFYQVGVYPDVEEQPRHWNGHLVIGVKDGLLDLDLGGFARTQHGINLPDGGFFPHGFGTYTAPSGVVIHYEQNEDKSYRRSRDYTVSSKWNEMAGTLIREAKAIIGEA
jgi:hypothetical protein